MESTPWGSRVIQNVTFFLLRTGLLAIVDHTYEELTDFFSGILDVIFIDFQTYPVFWEKGAEQLCKYRPFGHNFGSVDCMKLYDPSF